MGANHDCFFCTMSIVRYFDRNVKKCSTSKNVVITVIADVSRLTTIRKLSIKNTYVSTDLVSLSLAFLFGGLKCFRLNGLAWSLAGRNIKCCVEPNDT